MKLMRKFLCLVLCVAMIIPVFITTPAIEVQAANPYLPLWEHIPDGEPRVFQDPDDPTGTKQRVYIFGSHDLKTDNYCGPDIASWSAPINDLNNWRNDGPIFTSFNENTDTWDRMFAPDIVELRTKDPTNPKAKQNGIVYTYYLYPHNISDDLLSFNGFRMNMVAKADRPDGPFEVINWVDESDKTLDTLGPIGFDPGAFIDYDENDNVKGVYVFWGFQTATAGEMDPKTMYTLKPHTESKYNSQMYSDDSFSALTAAIASAQAVYNDAEATQAQVDAVIKGVLDKLPGLVRLYTPKPSPDALKAAISIGKALIAKYPGRYTSASAATLATRASEGETRINYSNRNSTQAQIDTAMNNILTAIDGLVQVDGYNAAVKKDALYVLIKRTQALSNDRPIDYFIPSSASTDNDTTYPYIHARAKAGRTADQVKSAFSFFEASSIRKIGNKYVMIYSGRSGSEYGMEGSSSTLRYAYGDTPMGPWVDGGVLVDSRGPEVNQAGTGIGPTNYASNTHGSIIEIPATNPDGSTNPNGESQWYAFYHRPPRGSGNARQSAVSPIKVEWDEASVDDGGSVRIRGYNPYADNKTWTAKAGSNEYTGAEVTSEGFNPYGLNPYQYYSAGIACYFVNNNPGSVINVLQDAYDVWDDHAPVTGMQNNNVIGYKYFDFENYTAPGNNTQFDLYLTPKTTSAFKVDIMMDSPWEGVRGGVKIGEINVPANSKQVKTKFSTPVPAVDALGQKHAIYLKTVGSGTMCDIMGLSFSKQDEMLDNSVMNPQDWNLNGEAVISDNILKLGSVLSYTSAATNLGSNWRNYEVISNINIIEGVASLKFMKTASGSYELFMKDDGSLELSSYVKSTGLTAILGTAPAGTITKGKAFQLGVNTDDGVISVRVDGILVLQAKNDDHDNGTVEFLAGYVNHYAEISSVLIRAATEKEVALTSINIAIDGNPVNVASLSPVNYTVFNGIYDYENYETYYPVSMAQKTAPNVTASSSDKDVKISISQADGAPGVAIVRFNKGDSFKSFLITFSPGATITPAKNGAAFGNAAKAAGDVVELGKLKDLVAPEKWGGNWDIWVNVASNPFLTASNFTANTQAGLAIVDGTNPAQNYFRVNTRYQSATQVGGGAGWVVNGGAAANGTNRNFNASRKQFYVRIVKVGNTLRAYSFTNTSTSTNWDDMGAAQTYTADFFENATLQAYATNASAFDLTATVAVVPDIMGVQSTVYSTYELFSKDQIAVDAAGIAVGDGVAYKDSDLGANVAEKATNAVKAKLAAAGTVTVKKATDSQVKKYNYDTNLSTYQFDELKVTTGSDTGLVGPFTLTVKSGNASMVIDQYNAVNVTNKGFEQLTALINRAKGLAEVGYTTSSWARLQEALAPAMTINASDEALLIASSYDKLNTALGKLEDTGESPSKFTNAPANPFMPMWSHVPDTAPYVFEDPDKPGKYRLYWYGSHDTTWTAYCGRDLVLWSAPVEDLSNWRYHGVIFELKLNRDGENLNTNGNGDTLYAPDVCEVIENGKKVYYLYPHSRGSNRLSATAKADRPDGPFTNKIINWSPTNPNQTVGNAVGADPCTFWDEDTGRAFTYYGIGSSTAACTAAEVDPTDMVNRLPGTNNINLLGTVDQSESGADPQHFRYFEAPSMHKIKFQTENGEVAKYVLIYARRGMVTEKYGWGACLKAYAYADDPLGPFTYGGVIVDAASEELEDGSRAFQSHNTHGGIFEINGQWYIGYHRCIGTNGNSRQSVVEPIEIRLEGDRVVIPEVEMTSMGFQLDGLNPYRHYSAGIACYYTGGSYIKPDQGILPDRSGSSSGKDDWNPVVNIKNGAATGYKYFNFDKEAGAGKYTALTVEVVPNGVDGFIDVYLDRPSIAEGGTIIGTIPISASMEKTATELTIPVPQLDALSGKHAIFFKFNSNQSTTNICEVNYFEFKAVDKPASGVPVGIDVAMDTFDRYEIYNGDTVNLTVYAIDADGTRADVTSQANVAISSGGASYSNGKITAAAVGVGGITVSYNGFTKYVPFNVAPYLPKAAMITVDGENVKIFSKDTLNYSVRYPNGTTKVPEIGVILPSSRLTGEVKLPATIPGIAEVIVEDLDGNSATYTVAFEYSPTGEYFAKGSMSDSWKVSGDLGNWKLEKGKGLVLPTDGIGSVTGASSGMTYNNVFTIPAAGDWKIVAKVVYPTMPSSYNSQQFGLYAWEDGNNYVTTRGLLNQANRVSVQRGKMLKGAWTQATGATNVNLVNGTIYYCLEKRDNLYCASYSTDGINFNNSNGDNIGQNGVPLRNVQIGLFGAKAASGNPSVDVYCEYISVLTAGGERIMTNVEMLQNAVDNVLDYVSEDVPKETVDSFSFSPVPRGYTLTVSSDKPDVISNTGVVTRSDKDETVNYTLTVSDGTRTASKTVAINVKGDYVLSVSATMHESNGALSVFADVYSGKAALEGKLIAAAYKASGQMIAVAEKAIDLPKETREIVPFALDVSKIEGDYSVKVFLWDKDWNPIIGAVEATAVKDPLVSTSPETY